jgi:hypothetical protein
MSVKRVLFPVGQFAVDGGADQLFKIFAVFHASTTPFPLFDGGGAEKFPLCKSASHNFFLARLSRDFTVPASSERAWPAPHSSCRHLPQQQDLAQLVAERFDARAHGLPVGGPLGQPFGDQVSSGISRWVSSPSSSWVWSGTVSWRFRRRRTSMQILLVSR